MKSSAVGVSASLPSTQDGRQINTNSRVHARDFHHQRHAHLHSQGNTLLSRREVPQEHSHKKFITKTGEMLRLSNPDRIVDPIFGLLGNRDGSAGRGSIKDTNCLQQATADQAFTNAKAIGDIDGMTAALIYRALERNTDKVGLASLPCTSITAANPEIAVIKQHQDPASPNAITINFNIAINLALQIASIGGDPKLALQSGTFAPGDPNDSTAAGNTCDDPNDDEGCIYTQNLLVQDTTVDDIISAVAAAGTSREIHTMTNTGTNPNSSDSDTTNLPTPSSYPTALPAPNKPRPYNPAEVIAPTVTICVTILAVILWWTIRRARKARRRRRLQEIAEKAEWGRPEVGKIMRARLVTLESRSGDAHGTATEKAGAGARLHRGAGDGEKSAAIAEEVRRHGNRPSNNSNTLPPPNQTLQHTRSPVNASPINNPYINHSHSRSRNQSQTQHINANTNPVTPIPRAKFKTLSTLPRRPSTSTSTSSVFIATQFPTPALDLRASLSSPSHLNTHSIASRGHAHTYVHTQAHPPGGVVQGGWKVFRGNQQVRNSTLDQQR